MFFRKRKRFYNMMIVVQNTIATLSIIMAIVSLFDKKLGNELTITLSLFLLVLSFNSFKFEKNKSLGLVSLLIAVLLLLGVII